MAWREQFTRRGTSSSSVWIVAGAALPLCIVAGCLSLPVPDNGSGGALVFYNTTDPTNGGAGYVGSAACTACHQEIAGLAGLHAHAHALKGTEGDAPGYPPEALRAAVPGGW